jgi:hypothetical protein
MPKRTAATWVEQELYDRLKRVAKVDRRSVAEVMAMAIEKGLPMVEQRVASMELEPAPRPPAAQYTHTEEAVPPYRVSSPPQAESPATTTTKAVAGIVAGIAGKAGTPPRKRAAGQ